MTGAVVHTDEADEDLINIWLWVAERNQGAADELLDSIESKLRLIARSPLTDPSPCPKFADTRCHIQEERIQLSRGHINKEYCLLYRALDTGSGIELIRVLRGASDIEGLSSKNGC